MSSAYFNITDAPEPPKPNPSSSSLSSTTPTPTQAQSPSPTSMSSNDLGQQTSGQSSKKGSSDTSDGSASLSTGAKAGIAIGAGVVGLAVIGGLVGFLVYRRRKKNEIEELGENRKHDQYLAAMDHSKENFLHSMPFEPPAAAPVEAARHPRLNTVVELG
ncbi:hypothetical protein HIM_05803 [Hirsutella minnesotensis 3608]|uniref:Mid2 domain-containing protein n=1 Tax=Hirsutella minnesotensis 3608 TaxID=1043627 RepID=A0A0F8A586_9HYPO|nr:hypothetical protein HIM_05803 [Hirsutella minnesotensis 3608]